MVSGEPEATPERAAAVLDFWFGELEDGVGRRREN
jgi:hypothetical protein